jgi:septal ring factor EnvC (AmiA/AmiB activator)
MDRYLERSPAIDADSFQESMSRSSIFDIEALHELVQEQASDIEYLKYHLANSKLVLEESERRRTEAEQKNQSLIQTLVAVQTELDQTKRALEQTSARSPPRESQQDVKVLMKELQRMTSERDALQANASQLEEGFGEMQSLIRRTEASHQLYIKKVEEDLEKSSRLLAEMTICYQKVEKENHALKSKMKAMEQLLTDAAAETDKLDSSMQSSIKTSSVHESIVESERSRLETGFPG